jgi:hypothetical protein
MRGFYGASDCSQTISKGLPVLSPVRDRDEVTSSNVAERADLSESN